MLLEKESKVLEKLKVISVAVEYAEKADERRKEILRVWNLLKTNVYLPFEKCGQSYT